MKIKPLVISLSLILATSFTLPAYADISIEFKSGSQHKITDEYFKSIQEEGALISIANLKEKTIKMPNERDKTYLQMSPQDMCNTGKVMQETVADNISNMLENLPAEQREKMAAILASRPPSAKPKDNVEIINLGESDTIAGYKTTKYKIVVNDQVKEILWQTTDKKIINEVEHLYAFGEEISCDSYDDYQDSLAYKALSKKGYPLKTYLNYAAFNESNNSFGDNHYEEDDIEEVVSVNFNDISNTEFQVPADYKKTTREELMQKMTSEMQRQAQE